jgi:Domain of unknown function (DUF222)
LALDLAIRLPGTAAALRAGEIDYLKARIIAEATRVLSPGDARRVEARILARAGQQTSGQLRAALARAILAVDPEAARRRREDAQRDPRVRRWREDAGTAALAGYGLPPVDVLEADQHLTERAQHLRAAGLPGTLDEPRARAYLDALLGRDSAQPAHPAEPAGPGAVGVPSPPGTPSSGPPESGPSGPSAPAPSGPPVPVPSGPPVPVPSGPPVPVPSGPPVPAPSGPPVPAPSGPPVPAPSADASSVGPAPSGPAAGAAATARSGSPATLATAGGRLAARINVTVPLMTLLGLSGGPAEVGGFGPIDPALARDITQRAATHPHTSWT